MKFIQLACLLLIGLPSFFSCKKSNDAGGQPDIKNTIWSGEFHYTTGAYTGVQPFTLRVNTDSTLEWTDVTSTRPGGTWRVTGNQVTMTLPNMTMVTATISTDKWTDFVSPAANGFQIDNLSKTSAIAPTTLPGTNWSGDVNGSVLKLKFLDASKMEMSIGAGSVIPITYAIAGAGVRFGYNYGLGNLSTNIFYAIFQNSNTTLKGFDSQTDVSITGISHFYNTWNAKKQ